MLTMTSRATTRKPHDEFERDVLDVVGRLQAAVRDLIEATPGPTERPAALAQTLGIHAKLAWQAHRLAFAADPLAESGSMLGPVAMGRLLGAAARRGVPAERIKAVRGAQRDLERLIKRHAGSRAEFGTMLSALAEGGADQVDQAQKRAAFRAYSHILGVQAKMHLSCQAIQPSATRPDCGDCLAIRGLIGLRRFRHNAAWIISQTRYTRIEGGQRRTVASVPLDPRADAARGVSLLTDFCSRPLPEIRRVPMGVDNMDSIEIVGSGVGNASEVTCLVGDLYRDVAVRYRDEHNRYYINNLRVRMPCEALVFDVLVHESLVGFDQPGLSVFTDHRGVDVILERDLHARECDRLALRESLIYLGKGPRVMDAPGAPQYPKLIRYAFRQAGWNPDKFRVYRVRVDYPVVPTSVVVHFTLPEAPA